MYTRQEGFDIVVVKLYEQGEASRKNSSCLYKNSNGNKCAIGHLIPDELYNPEFEGKPAGLVIQLLTDTGHELFDIRNEGISYWNEMQTELHDMIPRFNSKEEFRIAFIEKAKVFAKRNGLRWNCVY